MKLPLVLIALLSTSSVLANGKRSVREIDGTIATNRQYLRPTYSESCHPGNVFKAPDYMADADGRLIVPLREAAANHAVMDNLLLSAKYKLFGSPAMFRAYADLSVTGSKSFKNFERLHQNAQSRDASLRFRLRNDPELSDFNDEQIDAAINATLDRAYQVAWAILTGNKTLRERLGWIAVSGEDDTPHRPVNVMGTEYVQRNLEVEVQGIKINTRYIVAQAKRGPQTPTFVSSRDLPQMPGLTIDEDAKVILFIHGMDSMVEEALPIIKILEQKAAQTGENWTVIAMDMPTSGYATKVNHFDISPISDIGTPKLLGFNARGRQNTPLLDFMENFVVAFVDKLETQIPIKDKIKAVIGGSMGGNLSLRLGRRVELPWIRNIVSWSAASTWRGFADGANIFTQLAVATTWKRAGGDQSEREETSNKRHAFFDNYFGGAVRIGTWEIVPSQPEHWYASTWPCFDSTIEEAKIQKQEIYNTNFRLWHWRLAAEQLLYSHRFPPGASEPRYYKNTSRTLFVCGMMDNFRFSRICGNMQTMSQYMRYTPGEALFIYGTGHSIHSERPHYFTERIVDFLNRDPN